MEALNVSIWKKTKNFLCPRNVANTVGADNWRSWLSLFKMILMMIVCKEFPAHCVCFSNSVLFKVSFIQKQPSREVLKKRCSGNMQQIYRRTPCWSVVSIKLLCNFIEIALRHGCSPVNLPHIFRIPFLKNTSGRLLVFIALWLIHFLTLNKLLDSCKNQEKEIAVKTRFS